MSKECTTHHFACDCREEKFKQLEQENAALKQRILDDNKAYGCELMDPSGTIWDHAKRLQQENATLRKDKERLDWLGSQKDQPWLYWERPLRLTREAIDAFRKEAQP